jgi:hypothetical protein
MAVGKSADHPWALANLADDPLEWIIRFDLAPVLLGNAK